MLIWEVDLVSPSTGGWGLNAYCLSTPRDEWYCGPGNVSCVANVEAVWKPILTKT